MVDPPGEPLTTYNSVSTTDQDFELGLWLRSLEAFCAIGRLAFAQNPKHSADHDYKNECRITRAVLLRISELIAEIELRERAVFDELSIQSCSSTIKTLLTLNSALLRSDSLAFDEWQAWSRLAADRIRKTALYQFFEADFRRSGTSFLPPRLRDLLSSESLTPSEKRDLAAFLPRFGGILRSLDIVGRMLKNDEPMKPTLAIFAFIYESANELISDINVRLDRFEDETSELFGMLDRRVVHDLDRSKEGILLRVGRRGRPSVGELDIRSDRIRVRRFERQHPTAVGRFCTAGRAGNRRDRYIPEFHLKLEQSIELRKRLYEILTIVRELEPAPTEAGLISLRAELKRFLTEPVSFLFYKDRETFERFCTEIAITGEITDAGPVLHRFFAYLETLFGQVCIRAVLSNHPFDP
jgi:hypothetical protein